MRKLAPRVIALVALATGLGYLIAGREYPIFQNDQPGSGIYPTLVGAFWVIAAVAAVVETWREPADAANAIDWPDRRGWLRIAVALAAAASYVLLVGMLGDLVMSFLVMIVVMRAMGMTNALRLLGVSLSMSLVWHLVFVTALRVALPQGIWVQ